MSELHDKDAQAMAHMGDAFMKVPRTLIERMFSLHSGERTLALLHLHLLFSCSYADRMVSVGRRRFACRRGEYIGFYSELSDVLRIPRGSVGYYLEKLVQEGLIVTRHLGIATSIRVLGYEQLMGRKRGRPAVNPLIAPPGDSAAARLAAEEATCAGNSIYGQQIRQLQAGK